MGYLLILIVGAVIGYIVLATSEKRIKNLAERLFFLYIFVLWYNSSMEGVWHG
jgi:hypothetical protein